MKHGRKVLCLLLALALLLGCLPAAGAVSAREAEPWRTMCAAAERSEENPWRTLCAATEALADDRQPVEPAAVCTVRFDLNGYGPDAPAAQTVTKGQPAADPGFTDYTDGMLFDGWYTEPACVNLYDFSAPVNNNLTLYASYVRGHVIHFEPNGATEGGMEDVYVRHGEAFVLPECGFLYAGKALDYWTASGQSEKLAPGYTLSVFHDYTVTANWKDARLVFDSNGGTGYMSNIIVSSDNGGIVILPDCTYNPPSGKIFERWSLGLPGDAVTLYGNMTAKAVWTDEQFAISFDPGEGSGTMASVSVIAGAYVLPECGFVPPQGYDFECWSVPDGSDTPRALYAGQKIVVSSDTLVTAVWRSQDSETCTVRFYPGAGIMGTMPEFLVQKGAAFTLPDCDFTPPSGCRFSAWMIYEGNIDDDLLLSVREAGRRYSVNCDISLLPAFSENTYFTVSFNSNGHGSSPEAQQIPKGERAHRPEDPSEAGWRFVNWYLKLPSYFPYDFNSPVTKDLTLLALWYPEYFQLILSSDGSGSAQISDASAAVGTEITVTATPEEGYVVDRITCTPAGGETVDITGTGSFTMPPANVAVGVRFKPVEPMAYPITLEVVGGGSAVLSKTAAEPWERVTLSASPEEGGALLRAVLVSPDGTEKDVTERMGFNMPEGPATVRVEFTSIPHHLTLEVGPGGTANLSAETAPEGEEIIVTTTPNSGFRLKSILVYPDERTTPCSGAQCAPGARSAQPDGSCAKSDEIPWRTMCAATGTLAQTGTDITETGRFQMPAYDVKVVVVFEELPPVPVYSLRLEVGPGGTASLSASEAEAGTEITVSTAPDRGRAVQAIRVKTESGSVTDVTAAGRFSMPAENVSVEIVFAWINPFVDVSEADWFYTPVLWAYYNEPQITAGTDPTHFSPDNTVTRAEAMVFFWAANGHPEPQTTKSPFKDVKKSHWAFKAVMWAVENGITGGTDAEGKYFSPARTCTRSEILQFLYAAMGKPEYHIANPYSDVKNKHWYKDGAIWAYEYGLERGENGKFHATTPCTRAYVVTYLYRYFTGELLDE